MEGLDMEAIVLFCLGQPQIRGFLEEVIVKVFAEVLVRSKDDPVFEQKFTTLSRQLGDSTLTLEERQNVLKQINALRTSPVSPS